MHDDEITSDEFDELLDKAETLRVDRPADSTGASEPGSPVVERVLALGALRRVR
jgi:hypothetical protein